MRWNGQALEARDDSALPGMQSASEFVRSVHTPEFGGITFHEVLAKSALNHVPGTSRALPFGWTINAYRGCSHACRFCFARPTHDYLGFDMGDDFDRQIVVKVNVAEVLERELAKPSWRREHVALGTNTDPYQRAEGRYSLMPGIVSALASSGTEFGILTKGTLLRRDLPLLADARASVPIDIAMTIAIFDDDLQRSLEPGAPSTAARLATITAVREHGFDCSVFLMPVLPYLTDTIEHLDEALARVKRAGATRVVHSALHLRPGVKEWFMGWLERERPELVAKYEAMYARSAYAPAEYRKWLAARIRPRLAAHGLAAPKRERMVRAAPKGPSAGSPIAPPAQATLF